MTLVGWLQIALALGAVLTAARPLGHYMAKVFQGEKTWASVILAPVEERMYAAARVAASKEQTWLGYTLAMLSLNSAGFLFLYVLMRLQAGLPLNPQGFAAVSPDLAFARQ